MSTLLQIMKKPQLKISLPTDQTMSTLNRETALFHIDSLKRSNCQILSKILNNYWSAAAFDRSGLDHQIIHHLIKKVKKMGLLSKEYVKINQTTTPGLWCWEENANVLNYLNQKKKEEKNLIHNV